MCIYLEWWKVNLSESGKQTKKLHQKKIDFFSVGKAYKSLFWPAVDFKEGIFNGCRFSANATLILMFMASLHGIWSVFAGVIHESENWARSWTQGFPHSVPCLLRSTLICTFSFQLIPDCQLIAFFFRIWWKFVLMGRISEKSTYLLLKHNAGFAMKLISFLCRSNALSHFKVYVWWAFLCLAVPHGCLSSVS